jgi:hypothetical protein
MFYTLTLSVWQMALERRQRAFWRDWAEERARIQPQLAAQGQPFIFLIGEKSPAPARP